MNYSEYEDYPSNNGEECYDDYTYGTTETKERSKKAIREADTQITKEKWKAKFKDKRTKQKKRQKMKQQNIT